MAQVKDNLVTEGASGKLGKRLVFRHMKDGRTITPVPTTPATNGQPASRHTTAASNGQPHTHG